VDYNPRTDPNDATTNARLSFSGLGNAIETAIGGTLGEDLSFWGQAAFNRDELELNRIFLTFSNIIGDSYSLNARIGVLEPQLFSFSTHRAWLEGYWFTTRAFDDNHMKWTFEEKQSGIEANGMAADGRLFYSAGVVEGFGAIHSDKDYYGHVAYKFGGLPLDGVTAGGPNLNNLQPYIDNSFTVGVFGYKGNAMIGADSSAALLVPDSTHAIANQASSFSVFGGDINIWYDRFNIFGGVSMRTDDHPFLEAPGLAAKTTATFGEIDVVAFPWLLPGVRVESWKSQKATVDPSNSRNVIAADYQDLQIVPGIVFLFRPNVKWTLRTNFIKADGDSKFQMGQTQLLMTLGM